MIFQRLFGVRSITMACPCCIKPAKLRLNQINKKIGCPKCKGQFEADPDAKLSDVIRIYAGCSVTKDMYGVAFRRGKFGKHLFFTTFNPEGDSKFFWTHEARSRAIPIGEVDFGKFECPGCESRMLDFCSKCGTWICHGGAHPTPRGRENICPNCGPNIYEVPITEMKIAEGQPMQSAEHPRMKWGIEVLYEKPPETGSALVKWSGK